jgi:hypothetical protein
MLTRPQKLQSLSDLRNYVHQILCVQNELEPNAFPMTERILMRSGSVCGLYFCLHGPRSVKLSAIWETQCNRVLFYGSTGERICKVQLVEAPRLDPVAV